MVVSQPQSKRIYWFLILVFILFSAMIGTGGYFFYTDQKKSLKQEKWNQIRAIASLKGRQITEWRKDRMGDAQVILTSPFIIHHYQEFLQNPKATRVRQELLEFMASLQRSYHYQRIFLLDATGTVRLSAPEGIETIEPHAKKLAMEAIRQKKVTLSDLYRSETSGLIHLSLLVPLLVPQGQDVLAMGVFLLRIDPYQFLYPLLQSWPTPSRSSESILVRREGDEILFLNDLVHKQDAALKFRLPISEKRLPAVMAVTEKEGIVEGVDYRGVPVIAALRKIPDSPWFLVAKMDQEEIYTPIRWRARFIAVLVGILIFGVALGVVLLWRNQRLQFQKEQFEAGLERRALIGHLDYLTKHANDIILLMDQDMKIVEANERAAENYGYTHEELLGLSLKDLRVPETWPALGEDMKKVKEENGYRFEVLHQRKDGTRFPVENSSRVIEVDGKSFYQSIIRDVTERKRTEEILRESEKRFEELFDEAPVGYHELDRQGCLNRVNRTELEMLGYTLEEMIGQPVWKFIMEEGDSRKSALAKLAGTLPAGRAFERNYRRKDGTPLPVLIEDRLIRDLEGRIIGIRATIQDITERKRAEQEMAALQEQLRQSQRVEAIGRLAGGIAHDFNNLLTVIKGYCQFSLTEIDGEDPLRANIEEIGEAADRAAVLTRQLLAFSRRQIMEMKVLDLNEVLRNLDRMLRRVIGEDIELVTLLAEDLGNVKTDSGQIEQVIMNLSVNARDAMPEGGKLTIETANVELDEAYAHKHIAVKPGQYVMLSVSDTGVGMPSEVRDKIFEPFFTTKEKGRGTGLGLSTVYGIVKQSGGNIWVYSEPGRGTTFKIYLPRVDEPLEEIEKSLVFKEELPRGSETILVVEDDEEVRKLTVRVLEKQGYKVLEAAEGIKAFLICEEHEGSIDLLVTDVVMPKMSGRELANRIVSIRPGTKVLYMSGYTDNAIVHHGVLGERMNYIQKPFTIEGLARRVREVLDK